jgi:transposase
MRRSYRRRERPVWARVQSRLEELVAEWEPRTTAKQRLTGVRPHRALLEEGYQVGLTTIHQYLRERRRQRAEVFVPLIHRVGDEAQVDFFEVTVELEGQWHKAWNFLLRLMDSGREFVWLSQRCDTVAFLDGHVRAFAYLGGVPRRCIYDNLPAAVRKIVGVERKLTKRFEALVSHYCSKPCFARVGEGHDKGGVESRGKGIRLQHMVPVPRGESLTAIAQTLITDLERAFRRAPQLRRAQPHRVMARRAAATFALLVQEMHDHRVTPHFARKAKHYRPAYHPPSGIRAQSAQAQTSRGDLR